MDVWLHAASVGDVRAVGPFIEGLCCARSGLRLRLSVTTRSGRAVARKLHPSRLISGPPLAPGAALRALRRSRPRLLVFEYLELWPGWIAAASKLKIPCMVIDGRVSHRSLRVRWLLARAAGRLDVFCAQTPDDGRNAAALGVRPERIFITGNGKHDAAQRTPVVSADLRQAVGSVRWVVGSLHADEEVEALAALAAVPGRALIAPRYLDRVPQIIARARKLGVDAARRSTGGQQARWVVLDTHGELAAAYGLGQIAVVGGTFGRRDGQNLVEPAAWGRPVLHGPRTGNTRLEAEALAGRGALQVGSWDEAFGAASTAAASMPDPRVALASLRGATGRHVALALGLLDGTAPGRRR